MLLSATADLDVLVHGEAERNDMVEYFAENLAGFQTTKFGWAMLLYRRETSNCGCGYWAWKADDGGMVYLRSILTSKQMKGMLYWARDYLMLDIPTWRYLT